MATRKRGLLEYSIPEPAGMGQPQSAPPLGLLGTAENVSMGLGRGVTNQLAGLLGMVQNPGAVVNSLYGLARTPPNQLAQMAVTGVKDTARNALAGPLGFGEFIGNNMSPRSLLPGVKVAREATAYHGSPHDFDEFNASKIGTGEGNHSFGYGFYLTDSKDVASPYKNLLDKSGREIPTPNGRVYTVDVPDDAVAKMVNLDLPLSQQPEALQQIAKTLDVSKMNGRLKRQIQAWRGEQIDVAPGSVIPEPTAGELLDAVTDYGKNPQANMAFSERLKEAGVPGLVYRDRSQTGRASNARNFVVFDDKLVKVLKKE